MTPILFVCVTNSHRQVHYLIHNDGVENNGKKKCVISRLTSLIKCFNYALLLLWPYRPIFVKKSLRRIYRSFLIICVVSYKNPYKKKKINLQISVLKARSDAFLSMNGAKMPESVPLIMLQTPSPPTSPSGSFQNRKLVILLYEWIRPRSAWSSKPRDATKIPLGFPFLCSNIFFTSINK